MVPEAWSRQDLAGAGYSGASTNPLTSDPMTRRRYLSPSIPRATPNTEDPSPTSTSAIELLPRRTTQKPSPPSASFQRYPIPLGAPSTAVTATPQRSATGQVQPHTITFLSRPLFRSFCLDEGWRRLGVGFRSNLGLSSTSPFGLTLIPLHVTTLTLYTLSLRTFLSLSLSLPLVPFFLFLQRTNCWTLGYLFSSFTFSLFTFVSSLMKNRFGSGLEPNGHEPLDSSFHPPSAHSTSLNLSTSLTLSTSFSLYLSLYISLSFLQ